MLRVPQLPVTAQLSTHFEKLKYSISLASKAFYDQVKETNPTALPSLKPSVKYAIGKYFNRARFRSTPFGNFASISQVSLDNTTPDSKIRIERQPNLKHFKSWNEHRAVQIPKELGKADQTFLISNSSYYLIGHKIRFLSYQSQKYQIAEIDQDPQIEQILAYCEKPRTLNEVRQVFPATDEPEILSLLTEMLDCQLLLDQTAISLIGPDRLKQPTSQSAGAENYVIASRQVLSGSLNPDLFKHLPDLIEQLHARSETGASGAIRNFAESFFRKYADREVPIMEALDPEFGIGYQGLEHSPGDATLFEQVITASEKKEKPSDPVLDHLKAVGLDSKVPIDWPTLPHSTNIQRKPLPNTFSAILGIADEQIWLYSIGGVTSNALTGRFSLENEEWTTTCREVADLESQANPEVLFFDVCYQGEPRLNNINRRAAIYPYQLNILSHQASANQLSLSDLMVSVHQDQVYLRSRKHNKRLIPRIASAYNHMRADLSLFRFLCDLQGQGLQTHFNLDFWDAIPGLKSYPRIQYKNIILSPAKWLIAYQDIIKASGNPDVTGLQLLLRKMGCSQILRTGQADQTLLFDASKQEDLRLLLNYLQKHQTCYVLEAPLVRGYLVADDKQQNYHAELILSLRHRQQIYQQIPKQRFQQTQPQKIYLFDDEWLYLEIYSHYRYADTLLTGIIKEFIAQHWRTIQNWFFIRYSEKGDHLRLRIQLKRPEYASSLLQSFSHILKEDLHSGRVSEFLHKPYRPETGRYSALAMTKIEQHFCVDSDYTLQQLLQSATEHQKYQMSEHILQSIATAGLFEKNQFHSFCKELSEGYLLEHNIDGQGFRLLNKAYLDYSRSSASGNAPSCHAHLSRLIDSFIYTLMDYDAGVRAAIFADLIHMHFNRLFSTHQRFHEMTFYYFICKARRIKPKIKE